jgi:DNA-binding NarL/FixJ family response regulator
MSTIAKEKRKQRCVQSLPEKDRDTAMAAKIFIVDDFPIVRDGLAQIIDQQPGLNCIGCAGNSSEALVFLSNRDVDLVIVDISLGHENGLDLMSRLYSLYPRLRMLALSMHNESLYAEYALSNGARGYVMKEEVTESIVNALHCVLRGGVYLSEKMVQRLLGRLHRSAASGESVLESLTRVERNVFEMLGRGCLPDVIAGELDLSSVELDAQINEVKNKAGIRSTAYLEALAVLFVHHG